MSVSVEDGEEQGVIDLLHRTRDELDPPAPRVSDAQLVARLCAARSPHNVVRLILWSAGAGMVVGLAIALFVLTK
jgi:hypothetical protein